MSDAMERCEGGRYGDRGAGSVPPGAYGVVTGW